jgi:predicted transposase YdaD
VEKTWDNSLSLLINSHPQAFVDLFLSGAVCRYHHRTKLSGTQRQPDAVLEVERYEDIFLFNPDFQSASDTEMAERSLLYHVLLANSIEHRREGKQLAVRSCVVALWKRAKVAPSPLRLRQPGEPPGRQSERICFCYETIAMWEKRPEEILDLGHAVLYPLLPLTKGGATRKIVALMFELLTGEENRDYAVIGYLFATQTFKLENKHSELKWLERKFRQMQDFLSESPAYQWILEEGEEKGVAQGIAQGIAQGMAQGVAQMRETIVNFVREHFPELVQLAEEVVATMDNLSELGRLSIKLGGAQDAEQARKFLLEFAQ